MPYDDMKSKNGSRHISEMATIMENTKRSTDSNEIVDFHLEKYKTKKKP